MGYSRRVQKRRWSSENVIEKTQFHVVGREKNWSVDDHWKNWIFSDECQVEIGNNNRVYIWRKSDEVVNPNLVCATLNRKLSVMIWGCIFYDSVGTLTSVNGNINSQTYIEILENNLGPVIDRYFPHVNYVV